MLTLTCFLLTSRLNWLTLACWHGGVKRLYGSIFPSSSLAISQIFSHECDGCSTDWKSHSRFKSLYVWSEIKPLDHINSNIPNWSWKSSVRAFPTCSRDIWIKLMMKRSINQGIIFMQNWRPYHETFQIYSIFFCNRVVLYNNLAKLRNIMPWYMGLMIDQYVLEHYKIYINKQIRIKELKHLSVFISPFLSLSFQYCSAKTNSVENITTTSKQWV